MAQYCSVFTRFFLGKQRNSNMYDWPWLQKLLCSWSQPPFLSCPFSTRTPDHSLASVTSAPLPPPSPPGPQALFGARHACRRPRVCGRGRRARHHQSLVAGTVWRFDFFAILDHFCFVHCIEIKGRFFSMFCFRIEMPVLHSTRFFYTFSCH